MVRVLVGKEAVLTATRTVAGHVQDLVVVQLGKDKKSGKPVFRLVPADSEACRWVLPPTQRIAAEISRAPFSYHTEEPRMIGFAPSRQKHKKQPFPPPAPSHG